MLNEDVGILIRDADAFQTSVISTLPRLLLHSADRHHKPDAFKFKRNRSWIDVSSDEFVLRVEELFFALRALGVQAGDRVAIISENRLEWAIVDYATLCAGAVTVPVYPTLSAPQVHMLLQDSQPVVVFASTLPLLQKAAAARDGSAIRYAVTFDPDLYKPDVMRLDALYEMGRRSAYDYPGAFRRAALAVTPDQIATIIYTSGTTGIPKGAMLTHDNLVSNIAATRDRLPLSAADISLSFLPLSHIFQRHVDYASVHAGVTVAYAESPLTVAEDLISVKPTFAAGVPRFFEKIFTRVCDEVSNKPAMLQGVFAKALEIGRGAMPPGDSRISYKLADRLVFRNIRARLGGKIRFFISGGAALPKEIAEFFWAVGLPIYEGYGLSETSPVISLNGPGEVRLGSVGRVVGDQEVQIAEDGEILVRGRNVMKGYYHLETETAEALAGGWFHTGDIGGFDKDGFLRTTDRKKDLIITSSGKNIAPQAIENRLKLIPYFENVVVIGDHRQYVAALVVPNYAALMKYARSHKIRFENPGELPSRREIYEMAMDEIDRHTQDLAPFEKVKRIAFLEKEFTIDGEELTPTLKVRRSLIEKKYKSVIDALYTT
jgi:long-chain acyl-CoA synthetase